MMAKLNTTTPSGFLEFSPAQQRIVQQWKKVIAEVFTKHGFPMIETPLVERTENFAAKGGDAKEIYVLDRLHSDSLDTESAKSRAIRFDHTVPLALFVARNFNDLAFPFRRSVIGPVMRGERPQKGRFRQFDQCDIDVIGNESLSLANDAQMVVIIAEIFQRLMPDQKFVIRINNRKIIQGIYSHCGITDLEKMKVVMNIMDDIEKIGQNKTWQRLKEEGLSDIKIDMIKKLSSANSLDELDSLGVTSNVLYSEGFDELTNVLIALKGMRVDEDIYDCDFRIARGLDYYTGTVYETNLLNDDGSINTSLGSICSGGRYDDLAGVFTGKNLPGVGISIGLTRLLWQLFDAKIIEAKKTSTSDVIVLFRSPELLSKAIEIGMKIRKKNIAVENYFEPKKIQKQLTYADKVGIPVRVIVGENDIVVENRGNLDELKKEIEEIL